MTNVALISALRAFPDELAAVTGMIEPARMRKALGDGWSPCQIVGHLKDAAVIFDERAARLVSEDVPFIPAWDQEELAASHDYNSADPPTFIEEARLARARTVGLLERISDSDWLKRGDHEDPQIGNFSLLWLARHIVAHESLHLADLQKAATG
jgi:DinB superfamily